MYLLDTNVISEIRKIHSGKANKNVSLWTAEVDAEELYLSVVTIMELELGIISLARKDTTQSTLLRFWLEKRVLPEFSNRILPFDTNVARRCAMLHVPDRRSERDAMIAATALEHGMTIVTRNIADFAKMGLPLCNPWDDRVIIHKNP